MQPAPNRRILPFPVPRPGSVELKIDPRDAPWDDQILTLLVEMEQTRANLELVRSQRKPAHTLECMNQLVQAVVTFAEQNIDPIVHALPLSDALAQAGDYFSTSARLQEAINPTLWRSVSDWFTSQTPTSEAVRELIQHAIDTLLAVLTTFFNLFTVRFQAPASAERWTEAANIFLTDLNRVLNTSE